MPFFDLVNYNRSFLSNLNDISVPIDSTADLILEFGLFIEDAVNFVELITTVGWDVNNVIATPPDQPTLLLEIYMDGVLVGSTAQESISDGEDEPLEMSTTFQTILTNVATGHRVFQVFATNTQSSQGDITLTGPVNVTGKVIAAV